MSSQKEAGALMVSAWPVPDEGVAGDWLGRAARATGGDRGSAGEGVWEDAGMGFGEGPRETGTADGRMIWEQ